MTAAYLEIEANDELNRDLYFGPLGRRVRGRIDVHRALKYDADAAGLVAQWPAPIPGQRLAIDPAKGEAYMIEPLHEPQHAAVREKIEKRFKCQLPPERETFKGADVATWLFWLKQAVESDHATVVAGEVPDTIEGNPRTTFVTSPRLDPTSRLAEAFEKQTEMLSRLVAEINSRKR